jgi:hypothetical protein
VNGRWFWTGKDIDFDTHHSGGPKDGRWQPRPWNASRERLQAICDWANENDIQPVS